MDDKPSTGAAHVQGTYYLFKATKDCAGRCIKNYTKDLSDSESQCLDICGSNAAASRLAHATFMRAYAEKASF